MAAMVKSHTADKKPPKNRYDMEEPKTEKHKPRIESFRDEVDETV